MIFSLCDNGVSDGDRVYGFALASEDVHYVHGQDTILDI